MASQRDTRGKAWFGGDHAGGALVMRGSSTRGRGRRCLPGVGASLERATGLNVARGPLETSGAFVEGAVDVDVSEFPTLKTGFMVMRVILRQGGIMVTASPPDVGTFQDDFFFFGQWG